MRRRDFALPYFSLMSLCYVAPLVLLLERSFRGRDLLGGFTDTYSLRGWIDLVQPETARVLTTAFTMAFGVMLGSVAVAIIVATTVRSIRGGLRRWLLLLFWLPLLINSLLFAYGYVLLLRVDGPLTFVVKTLNLSQQPLGMLFSPGAIALGLFSSYFSICFFTIYAGLATIERRWLDVAGDLGATPEQVSRWVVRPLLRPSCLAAAALVFIPMLGEFLIPDLLGGSKTIVYGTLIRLQFTSFANWPAGAALASLLIIIALSIQVVSWRLLQRTVRA